MSRGSYILLEPLTPQSASPPPPPLLLRLLIASRCRRFHPAVSSPLDSSHRWRIASGVSVRWNQARQFVGSSTRRIDGALSDGKKSGFDGSSAAARDACAGTVDWIGRSGSVTAATEVFAGKSNGTSSSSSRSRSRWPRSEKVAVKRHELGLMVQRDRTYRLLREARTNPSILSSPWPVPSWERRWSPLQREHQPA